jgi:GLPGLI family protein
MITPKTYLSLLAILFAFTSYSQNQPKELIVNYDFKEVYPGSENLKVELHSDGQKCLSKIIREMYCKDLGQSDNEAELKVNYEYVFVDLAHNFLMYKERYPEKIVKETLGLFKWKITNKSDKILGYECHEAKSTFRGREYKAYFTTDLPFKAAPWKFHGLPGTVLKVVSEDNAIAINATAIQIKQQKKELKNPFRKKSFISYDTYVELYKKFEEEKFEKIQADAVKQGMSLMKEASISQRIEVILEANKLNDKQRIEMLNEFYQNQ